MTIAVRILTVLSLFLASFSAVSALPTSVSAQAECSVYINGVPASSSQDTAPTAPANSISGTLSSYPVNIVLSDPAMQRFQDCGSGGRLRMAIWESPTVQWNNRVDLANSSGNAFTGTLSMSSLISDTFAHEIWVEMKEETANCPQNYRICQTKWIVLDGETIEGNDVSCASHKNSLTASVKEIPSIVTNDQPVTVSIGTSPVNTKKNCGFSWLRYTLTHESGTQIEYTELPASGDITFIPDFSGDYRFTIAGWDKGMSGGAGTIVWSESKSFCSSPDGTTCAPPVETSPTEALNPYQICNQLSEDAALGNPRAKCKACIGEPGSENAGIWTAVGCIQINATTMVTQILRIAMGIAGGIALIMILAAGFMLSVSQGDPKRVSEARELITSAIVGLLFIIFSVTILQYIGVTLFRIPGFGG